MFHVKQDGTGDFTDIQEAINSIQDASESKQYVVYVFMAVPDTSDLHLG